MSRRDDLATRAWEQLVDADDSLTADMPECAEDAIPGNAFKQVAAMSLQKVGDRVVDAKTVLTWLLASVGAPEFLVGLLVPVRESGSMLPQAMLSPWVERHAVRKRLWAAGSLGQAVATLGMAGFAAFTEGAVAGWGILACLALLALARSLSSITSKDVLGRTIPKGARGRLTGFATVGSGLVAVTVGLTLRLWGGDEADPWGLALLLVGAAAAWVAAGAVFSTIVEPKRRDDDVAPFAPGESLKLLVTDAPFRRFVVARTLLLVSALSPPFVVSLATDKGAGLAGLGPFVISTGIASLVGGPLSGWLSDRSSRLTMVVGSAAASLIVLAFLGVHQLDAFRGAAWLYPATYLLLALAHTIVRTGRKVYVVDLAEGDQRTRYVATSNTAMGALLLVTGGVTSAVAAWGAEAALLLLVGLGLLGVVVSWTLEEVSAPRT